VYRDSQDRRPAITPRLALRVAIIGGAALALFAIVFFRLWYLQILSGDEYRAEANANRVREVTVQAPRGEIVDRNGEALVENRVGLAVQLTPGEIPEEAAKLDRLYRELSGVIDVSAKQIERRANDEFNLAPFSAATVEQDVDLSVVQYILEHQDDFPGVTVERVFLRSYPHEETAAHLFGTVGEVTAEQLEQQRYTDVDLGDRVGQSGVEYTYDDYLRGENGATRVVVDALGNYVDEASVKEPVQGNQLRLSLDLEVQEVGQEAIASDEAAFVAMEVETGDIIAMGSNPSFDPNIFSRIIKESDYERLSDEENGAPLANRATQGLYPTGSTFKLITATAALEEGLLTPTETLVDDGGHSVGTSFFSNAGGASYGSLQLPAALQVSSDDFFYQLGDEANSAGDGHAIQEWAGRLGLGEPTGVDIPGELGGLVPSPEWRNRLFEQAQSPDSPGGEEIVGYETDRAWSVGDNINLSVGQGDLQATPLQMAVAYATVANGGTVVEPHVGMRIEDADGRPIQELQSDDTETVDIDPEHRAAILQGLYQAANEGGGTSADVFAGFPIDIAGKTGTAETTDGTDQSWYAAIAPYDDPQYVVVTTFEDGGFGAETAAPAAREILATLLDAGGEGDAAAGESPD
jgi:penicillin-binding protein 2